MLLINNSVHLHDLLHYDSEIISTALNMQKVIFCVLVTSVTPGERTHHSPDVAG